MKTPSIVSVSGGQNIAEKYATKDELAHVSGTTTEALMGLQEWRAEFEKTQASINRQLFRRTLWLSGGIGATFGGLIVLSLRVVGVIA